MALVVASQRNGRHSLNVITMESVAGARLVDSSRIACVRSAPMLSGRHASSPCIDLITEACSVPRNRRMIKWQRNEALDGSPRSPPCEPLECPDRDGQEAS